VICFKAGEYQKRHYPITLPRWICNL